MSVDESTYGIGQRAELGVHVLLDTNRDALADLEVSAVRNADGTSVDFVLRLLSGVETTTTCQDLAGKTLIPNSGVASTIANGLETFAFSFDTTTVEGGLDHFRWVAFGQSPGDTSQTGPWDYLPDIANPDPVAPNPGSRRCDSTNGGIHADVSQGIDFNNATCPGYATDNRNQVVGTPNADNLSGTSGNDIICGQGGPDTLSGLGGSDLILGGSMDDKMLGQAGSDLLAGGDGNDRASGGNQADKLSGDGGNDTLIGSAGDDQLYGGLGDDALDGREGTDLCQGGLGVDSVVNCEP